MSRDPVVEEVRRIREEIAAEFGFDLSKIIDHLIERQQQHGDNLVALPPTRRHTHDALSSAVAETPSAYGKEQRPRSGKEP